jgi:hypothetical protein
MSVTYTNGFTEFGAGRMMNNGFYNPAPNYAPYGTVTFPSPGGTSTWGYGKTITTSLPTPQAYTRTFDNTTQTITVGESSAFDILRPESAISVNIVGVQFLKSDNTPVLEVALLDTAQFIYDGEFTILGGSTIDFGTTVDFYAK